MFEELKRLHACWNRMTGQEIKYQPCERALYELINSGFTVADLETVLTFTIHQNKKRDPEYRTRLLFHKICELEYFNSVAGEAVAWQRNRKPARTAIQKTVDEFRGYQEPPKGEPVKPIRTALEDALKQLPRN